MTIPKDKPNPGITLFLCFISNSISQRTGTTNTKVPLKTAFYFSS